MAAVLARARGGRGQIKRVAKWVDAQETAVLDALWTHAVSRGLAASSDRASWSTKKLLRACLDRSAAAQVRSNPIHRDEAFVCAHCGAAIEPHGRTARDHCPHCLRSLHVDVVPGDRAESCGGVLDPIGCEARGGELMLRYRCRRCGALRSNRAVQDGAVPDNPAALATVSSGSAL